MDVDGTLVDIDVLTPDGVEELGARIDAAWRLHQEFEQAELGRPEMQLLTCAAHAPHRPIELEIACGQ